MKAARLDTSDRLQRVHRVLSDGVARSTRDLIKEAEVCAVNSVVSELRANGVSVNCWREGDVWWYQIGEKA